MNSLHRVLAFSFLNNHHERPFAISGHQHLGFSLASNGLRPCSVMDCYGKPL